MKFEKNRAYKPYFKLSFGGRELDDKYKRYIQDIEYHESDSECNSVRITIADTDFILSNYIKLLEEESMELTLGYEGYQSISFSGKVAVIEGQFSQNNIPTLVVTAIDPLDEMSRVKKKRKWKNKKASDVAKQIAREYGFGTKLITETSVVYEDISQNEQTDVEVLSSIAGDEGFVFYLIYPSKQLFFGNYIKDIVAEGQLHYALGDTDILEFNPQLVKKDMPKRVDKKSGETSDETANTFYTQYTTQFASGSTQSTTQMIAGKPYIEQR